MTPPFYLLRAPVPAFCCTVLDYRGGNAARWNHPGTHEHTSEAEAHTCAPFVLVCLKEKQSCLVAGMAEWVMENRLCPTGGNSTFRLKSENVRLSLTALAVLLSLKKETPPSEAIDNCH